LDDISHAPPEEDHSGWGRMISLNPAYPNCNLQKETVDFGRKSQCVHQIKHPAVSGIHCELTHRGQGEVWLKDMSTNGTFLDGVAVGKGKKTLVKDGQEIVLIKSATDKIGYKFVLTTMERKDLNDAEKKYHLLDSLGTSVFNEGSNSLFLWIALTQASLCTLLPLSIVAPSLKCASVWTSKPATSTL
jgi:hypothetical protein